MESKCTHLFKTGLVDQGCDAFARSEFPGCVLLLDPFAAAAKFNLRASESQVGDSLLHCFSVNAFFHLGHARSTSQIWFATLAPVICCALHRIQQSGFNWSVTSAILSG